MRKRKFLFGILLLIALCAAMTIPALAASDAPRLVDDAGLLSTSEQSRLLEMLDEISERQQVDVVIVTTSTLDGKTPMAYADDFYDQNGYGYGAEYDGVLLLVSIEDNDWWISTCGYGMTAITDDGIEYVSGKFLGYLTDGDYAKGFAKYAELCDEFIEQAKTGKPYDGGNMPKEPFNAGLWLLASMGISIIAALMITGSMKSGLRSVKRQSAAASYVRANSMSISESRDMFLYNTVTRTERPKSNGGSSTHSSSSGRTHGGGGGKF